MAVSAGPGGELVGGTVSQPAAVSRDTGDGLEAGRARWLRWAFVAAGLAMVPWVVFLVVRLPSSVRVQHWSMAWVGLDTMEALGLIATGVLRDVRRCLTGAATAALLMADAWFDVTTAPPGDKNALLLALLEVPIAILCATLAVRTVREQTHRAEAAKDSPTLVRARAAGHAAAADHLSGGAAERRRRLRAGAPGRPGALDRRLRRTPRPGAGPLR
jgi:hypothetical protein